MYGALIEDDVTNLTAHELLYILETVPGESSTAAVTRLDLPTYDDPAPVLTAGLTSLYARGLAVVSEDAVQLSEVAALAGFVLTGAETWLELAFVSDESVDAGWLVRRESAVILLTPRRLGTFELRVLDPKLDGKWLTNIAFAFLGDRNPAAFFATRHVNDTEVGVAIRRISDGTFQFSDSPEAVLDAETVEKAQADFGPLLVEFMA